MDPKPSPYPVHRRAGSLTMELYASPVDPLCPRTPATADHRRTINSLGNLAVCWRESLGIRRYISTSASREVTDEVQESMSGNVIGRGKREFPWRCETRDECASPDAFENRFRNERRFCVTCAFLFYREIISCFQILNLNRNYFSRRDCKNIVWHREEFGQLAAPILKANPDHWLLVL